MRCAPPMRCPEFSRRFALDGRWLVDGALVNPVPVSAARVLGARLVIAVNLNTDILGRSMIMAGESAEPAPPPEPDAGAARLPHHVRRRARAQAPVRRRLPPARHSDRDGRRLQHHAGPHHAGAARRRSAGRHDQPAPRPHRLVRFPPRPGGDRGRRRAPPSARSKRSTRRSTALAPRPAAVHAGREIDRSASQAVWM